jgi:osmotically-inducible protein OsmY
MVRRLLAHRAEALPMKIHVLIAVLSLAAVPMTTAVSAQTTSPSTSANQPSDQELSRAIASKIAEDKTQTPDAVKVTVKSGVATLTGVVAKEADVSRVGQLARVAGVVRVDNKLTSREKAANTVKDAVGVGKTKTDATTGTDARPSDVELSKSIAAKISADKTLSADAVKVTVKGGVATITGLVAKDADVARVGQLANVAGVIRVENKVTSREKTLGTVK